ncbi:MAG: hypothetical protein WBQ94_30815 [Terracidiphilus sp.]
MVGGLRSLVFAYRSRLLRPIIPWLVLAAAALTLPTTALSASQSANNDPNLTCASSHKEIYDRYRTTPMANASGPAADGLITADFRHEASAVHYRVFEQSGQVWLSYQREAATPSGSILDGRQQLCYP